MSRTVLRRRADAGRARQLRAARQPARLSVGKTFDCRRTGAPQTAASTWRDGTEHLDDSSTAQFAGHGHLRRRTTGRITDGVKVHPKESAAAGLQRSHPRIALSTRRTLPELFALTHYIGAGDFVGLSVNEFQKKLSFSRGN